MVGVGATVVGTLLGIGLSGVVQQLLVKQLDIKITHFTAVNSSAVLFTLIFFYRDFLIGSIRKCHDDCEKANLEFAKS